jgi:hypothetical protein
MKQIQVWLAAFPFPFSWWHSCFASIGRGSLDTTTEDRRHKRRIRLSYS